MLVDDERFLLVNERDVLIDRLMFELRCREKEMGELLHELE
jgi:hypothetical protein